MLVTNRAYARPTFDPGVPNYHGPSDGRSRPQKYQSIIRPVLRGLAALEVRLEERGFEHLPRQGAHLYCPNHVSAFDVPLTITLPVKDLRFMGTVDLFQSPLGAKVAGWSGGFPVNKVSPSEITKEHSVEVVREGAGFLIYPEGRFTDEGERGGIGPFKKGAAAAALLGGAESVVPMAIHYGPNTKPRHLERVLGLVAGAATAGALLLPADPIARGVAGAVGGGLLGAYLGNRVGRSRAVTKEAWNPGPRIVGGLKGAGWGALVGAGAGLALAASPLPALAGGIAAVGFAENWRNRPMAIIQAGEAIDTAPYLALAEKDRSAATTALTEELHRRIGTMKAGLSGVPYDEAAPKITHARPKENWSAQD
ncbi:MAG: 1-acyl-sn-glycerol-3-phosphate acyltransferase [Candidatus Eremiobacteraeota bacterium]|nr:1-acyl-sn-glycerol-3-phosphate acyltransferase [Candidatus Eremiobacteraeota bacterium]